jgi:hypothetical protein
MNLRPFHRHTPEADKSESGPERAARAQEAEPRPTHGQSQLRMFSLQLPSFTDRR